MPDQTPSQSRRKLTANDKRILRALDVSSGMAPWDSSKTTLIYGPNGGGLAKYQGSVSCKRDTLARLRVEGWITENYALTDDAREVLGR